MTLAFTVYGDAVCRNCGRRLRVMLVGWSCAECRTIFIDERDIDRTRGLQS